MNLRNLGMSRNPYWKRLEPGYTCLQIDSNAYARQGKAVTNFDKLFPSPQSDLAQQALKDQYIFDCMTIEEPFRERELEAGLIKHPEKFLL